MLKTVVEISLDKHYVTWQYSGFCCTHLMSSSLAKIMTTRALGFSLSLRIILPNSPDLGSRGIFTDWEMHKPPDWGGKKTNKQNKNNVSKCFIRRTCLRCNLTQIMPLSSFNPYLFFNLLDFFYDKCTIKCALVQYFTEWGMQGIKKKVFLGQKEGILETGLTINSGYDSDSETRGQ